jgi:K+-sensing histidine kinase KdpD
VTADSIAIALPADLPTARAVLTHGRRLAHHLGLGWIAVFVQRRRDQRAAGVAELVTSSGGILVYERADDIAAALIEIAERERAAILVIGASRRPRILRRFIRGTTERILRAPRPFDVVISTLCGADLQSAPHRAGDR